MASADVDNLRINVETSATDAVSALTSLTSAITGLKDKVGEMVKGFESQIKATKSVTEETKKTTESVKNLAKSTEKSNKLFSKFLKSIGRIAVYRAIRSAIKSVSSAVKEGLTNLKAYSDVFGTAFSPAVDNLRRHVLYLKNALATALRPAIEALIPIVIDLINKFAQFADFVAQVTSVLFGKTDENDQYTRAILTDLQESNEEAKKLRRTLLGFDEINRLDGDNGKGNATSELVQFEQADVSKEARGVAEAIKSVDWDKVITAGEILLGIIAGVKVFQTVWKIVSGIVSTGAKLGKVAGAISGFVAAHPVLVAILAVITAMAIWGDKIAEAMRDAKKAVDNFFSGIDKDGGSAAAALRLIRDLIGTVLDAIGTVSSMVFKLFHGDLIGAAQDGVHLLNVILQGVVKIVVGVINIILGLVEDVVNGVIAAARWIWNNALQPVFNAVAKWFKQAGVDIHNAWISIRIGINDAIIWILEKINGLLGGLESVINGVIDLINWAFGENIQPVKLQIDTSKLKETKEELQNEKWPDIDQNIDLVGKWTETPEPLKLQIDASGLYEGMNEAEKNINAKLESLRKEAEKTKNTVASIGGSTGMAEKRALSPQKSFVQLYASGGYPSAGSMFIAGESGPELVASVGGTTGVWNSDQLIQGMYSAMSAALASNPSGGDIYLDGEVIYRNTVRRNNNAVRATGRSALLT